VTTIFRQKEREEWTLPLAAVSAPHPPAHAGPSLSPLARGRGDFSLARLRGERGGVGRAASVTRFKP